MTPVGKGGLRPFAASTAGRATLRLAAVGALLCALSMCFSSAARADNSLLCAGYSPCDSSGLTTHGYQNAADESWWSMYAGINCTNYAAYVESQIYGVPTPSLLLGDAYEWAERASEAGVPVDQTPTVGSVAVWGQDAPGMGGYGHVGVVESVAADGSYIDVSQSGMGTADNGYSWERVYRDGSSWESWPTSFIHFSGSRTSTALPNSSGSRVSGAELVAAGT